MKRSSKRSWVLALTGAALLGCALALISGTTFLQAQTLVATPQLGTAGSFAVLGGSTVTNTGPTVLNGDLGVDPGSAVTGFPPGLVHGSIHKADGVALQAQKDVKTAYNSIAAQSCNHHLTGQDLGGKTLVPGVYCFSSSAQLTGQLTLSGNGPYLFQIGSTLTTATNSSVLLHGANPCIVFWQVGSSATVGTNTSFNGNILALTSITFVTGAKSNGGLYARNGAVTLDTNQIDRSRCDDQSGGTPTPTPTRAPQGTPTETPTKFPGMPNTGSDPYHP